MAGREEWATLPTNKCLQGRTGMDHDFQHGDYLAVLEVSTQDELQACVVRFAQRLQFQTVSLTTVVERPGDEPEFHSVHNTPTAYRESFANLDDAKVDPVSQHCKRSHRPLVWDQSTYVHAGQGDAWEHQAQHGYRTGIAVVHHLPNGRHMMFGLDRPAPLVPNSREVTRALAAAQLFATYALEPAMRLLASPELEPHKGAVLSPRELEVLRWTMEGKTAWEIGRILGIAENTAIRHAHNASRKLGCSSKHHAVVKALRLGLIQ